MTHYERGIFSAHEMERHDQDIELRIRGSYVFREECALSQHLPGGPSHLRITNTLPDCELAVGAVRNNQLNIALNSS